jgi:hypothetical protein
LSHNGYLRVAIFVAVPSLAATLRAAAGAASKMFPEQFLFSISKKLLIFIELALFLRYNSSASHNNLSQSH